MIKLALGITQGSTHLATKPWRSQAIRRILHQIRTAHNIATSRSQATAQILNQGASHNICAHLGRLLLLNKLAVAVVHIGDYIRINFLGSSNNAANFCHADGLAQAAVAAGALDMHHFGVLGHNLFYGFQVHMLAAHGQLLIGDA